MANHYRYILFYKPYGVLSQFTQETSKHNTLKDYIPVPDVYPVGRLDWDSEGLLLLTNDGQLQHRLAHPCFGHQRTYWVQVEGIPSADALNKLQMGVEIQNYRTQPAQVRLFLEHPHLPERNPPIRFRKSIPTSWLEMTLTEGKNRQVRRMTATVGFPTLRLVRVSIAHLNLNGLQLGQWRHLMPSELKLLHSLPKKYKQLSRAITTRVK
ncbi:rRNA large subunit pseudouridine synthase E [Umezakia ovalisporum]|jgi:23S rRNA pseudouridine2457 synthase|uniref:Pseudouridine synthase n=1 Tax=Umezakia ovalisporum FSS-43 TaxID=2740520 RepID=A0ABT6K4H0_9CYAN|nr:rRNA large subunit pseudouridine synthase E [Umezakia ovalisporum]MBI1240290.1 pseudouridine synthase [Nostoc sp. RI_552]MDH6057253.1 rRNA large subunit pseudouridine synthase E [Umezakia ovalisporum FSS-43]MDH6068791.1 rRNA large subunit pseudouridine synthase E [Umezakia ovalisporum APH033B]MDH6070280.1 rRNA large subunit pseudouridine synthase E [Umezakia ovalisporum CobakiLakeA]MDH6076034.1 rRNA large subunit pseudouridine synthase E [Umezakia ovalisporum CS-1034]